MSRTHEDLQLPGCPDDAALARVVSGEPDQGFASHVADCPRCATVVREHRALADLAARLPFTVPGNDRRLRVRAAVLGGHALRAPRGRAVPAVVRWLLATLGLAAAFAGAGALALYVWPGRAVPPATPPAYRAVIEAASGARFERVAGPPHEVVRLYEGTIRTTVPPATQGETVRIVTGAGEVAVRGTIFDTTARDDRLVAVKVQRGRVVVRPRDGLDAGNDDGGDAGEVLLEAGRRWDAPVVETPAPPPIAPARVAPVRRAPRRDPAAQAFGHGLALLRAADTQGAAQAFEQAIKLAPKGTLVEDASYFRAVALVRNRTGEAALTEFLTRFPRSARAGEASVMLGWRLLDRGDRAGATARFEDGLTDPSARVRKSARAGLDAAAVAR